MMDFNPFTEDLNQYYWFDEETLMIPQGEWKVPMGSFSWKFDENGIVVSTAKLPYSNWVTDYNMYTYDEAKILKALNDICGAE